MKPPPCVLRIEKILKSRRKDLLGSSTYQNNTGKVALEDNPEGRNTFIDRQSSDTWVPMGRLWTNDDTFTVCKHAGPKLLASKVVASIVVVRTGGSKRSLPKGGFANGIPIER